MGGRQTLALWDYDKEVSTVTIPTIEIDETNLVLQSGYMDTFLTAVAGVSLGEVFKDTRVFAADQIAGTPPNDPNAQRERKWLVKMHDAVTYKPHTMEIPCADASLLDPNNKGSIDHTDPAWTAIKLAIENFYYTEAGNGVEVDDLVLVGRNL